MRSLYLWFFLLPGLLGSCRMGNTSRDSESSPDSAEIVRNREAREDSLEMVQALEAQSIFYHRLTADVETEPVETAPGEDAADDPAIWVNESDPASSVVLGTDKKAGIYVYDLKGRVIQSSKIGMINNIDLRDGFMLDGEEVVLVAGSNRTTNTVDLLAMDRNTSTLSDVILSIRSGVDEVYGICCYRTVPDERFYVFVNGKGGLVEQWRIDSDGPIDAEMVRSFQLNSQPEGMVADDRNGVLYVGVEQEGIFRLEADENKDPTLHLIPGSDQSNPKIAYDIEGLALFELEGRQYMIASSQGNFSYALFSLEGEGAYLESFIIVEGIPQGSETEIDGVEETDGLDLTTHPLNERFPAGLLVVQDGFNTNGDRDESQNFKYISLEKVLALITPGVQDASGQK